MKKLLILFVLLGVVFVGGSALVLKKPASISNELTKPWIEVVQPKAVELAANQKDKVRDLLTGDELSEGAVVEVLAGGLANIHFPDGSVARLDSGTKLVIEKGSFNPKEESLSVTLNLIFGRVWSKIIKLTSPESHWEVKTSTAVATVRGTSFGVEQGVDGKFSITGYENSVEVAMVDPDTKKPIDRVKLTVEPKKFLEINKAMVAEIKKRVANNDIKEAATSIMSATGALLLEVKSAPQSVLNKVWIKRSIFEDTKIEEVILQIRAGIKNEEEVRMAIRKELQDRFMEVILDRRAVLEQLQNGIMDAVNEVKEVLDTRPTNTAPTNNTTQQSAPVNTSPTNTTQPAPSSSIAPVVTVKPIALNIAADTALGLVKDGQIINFKATAVYSDGSTINVTEKVKWQVNGGIGVIEKPGVFVARWTADLGDLGSGSVSAWWQDEKTGINLFAESSTISIERVRTEITPNNSTGAN